MKNVCTCMGNWPKFLGFFLLLCISDAQSYKPTERDLWHFVIDYLQINENYEAVPQIAYRVDSWFRSTICQEEYYKNKSCVIYAYTDSGTKQINVNIDSTAHLPSEILSSWVVHEMVHVAQRKTGRIDRMPCAELEKIARRAQWTWLLTNRVRVSNEHRLEILGRVIQC